MEWLRGIILFAAGIGFLEWIAPAGAYEKYIKFIFSLLTLSVILSPLSAGVDLPVLASLNVSGTGDGAQYYQQERENVERIQELQVREILAQRIGDQAYQLLSKEFYGINREDIEVYIQQESLESGASVPCTIKICTQQIRQADAMRDRLQSGLQLDRAYIQIEEKGE